MRLITITTDFGLESEGAGIMEATILTICPTARVVQLCHTVTSFSTVEGARQLECAVSLGVPAIHIGVVDPGVGTDRRAVVVRLAGDVFLVGPDNGVLIPAARKLGNIQMVRQITSPGVLRQPVSDTFHGRDVFASVAGHLAAGVAPDSVGPALDPSELLEAPYTDANWLNGSLTATVIRINHFGNCILNANEQDIFNHSTALTSLNLRRGHSSLGSALLAKTFGTVPPGSLLMYPDSYGRVGIATNQGNFAKHFDLSVGETITLERKMP